MICGWSKSTWECFAVDRVSLGDRVPAGGMTRPVHAAIGGGWLFHGAMQAYQSPARG